MQIVVNQSIKWSFRDDLSAVFSVFGFPFVFGRHFFPQNLRRLVKMRTFARIFKTAHSVLSLMNDNELHILVERMSAGDREAFNAIFRRYYAPAVRFCFRFVADTDVAAEIVQDLFVKLWVNREKVNINTNFESYLLRAVRNGAITYINKERSHAETNLKVYSDPSESVDPSEELQSKNLEQSYQAVLAAMPEKRREVFLASRFDGLKYAEIAEKLGISVKTVEAHMGAAFKQLREGLKDFIE